MCYFGPNDRSGNSKYDCTIYASSAYLCRKYITTVAYDFSQWLYRYLVTSLNDELGYDYLYVYSCLRSVCASSPNDNSGASVCDANF